MLGNDHFQFHIVRVDQTGGRNRMLVRANLVLCQRSAQDIVKRAFVL